MSMSFRCSRVWLCEFCIWMPFSWLLIVMFEICASLPVIQMAGWFCDAIVRLPRLILSCVMFTGMSRVQFIVVSSLSSPFIVTCFVMLRHSLYIFLSARMMLPGDARVNAPEIVSESDM